MKNFWKMICNWLKKKSSKKPEPKLDMYEDDIDLSNVSWLGSNFSGAKNEAKFVSAYIDGHMIYTNYKDYGPLNWKAQKHGRKICDAMCCLFYRKGDKIVGGKFDHWIVGGQNAKTLKNVYHAHYYGHTMPVKGDDVWTMIVDQTGSKRSNVIKVRWK